MWCDRAGVKLKRKATTTERHFREPPVLTRRSPIYGIRFLFGQTTYTLTAQ
jgi:hypothetical protein